MAGEKSVLSGAHGQKIVKEFLKLMGWTIGEHIQFDCNNSKHRTASDNPKKNHDIDGLFQYNNPLNHSVKDIVLISAKHNVKKYLSDRKNLLNSSIKDVARCLECSVNSSDLNSLYSKSTSKTEHFTGLVFVLSSSPEQVNYNLIDEQKDSIVVPRDHFNTIYVIDNAKATFIYSAYKTAVSYTQNAKLKWLYHHTGLNQDPDDLVTADKILPIELMMSSVIPIVLEMSHQLSLLLFLNDNFDKEHLKRLIWLSHKIGYGYSEVVIFFKDFDATIHDVLVAAAKQEFSDVDFLNRIYIRKFDYQSFTTLKESSKYDLPVIDINSNNNTTNIINKKINDNDETIDKILPYGAMLKPMLSSSVLSKTDLKYFLKRRGIISKSSEKQDLVPLFANLLLSPRDIDELRGLLMSTEDKPKSLNSFTKWIGDNVLLESGINTVRSMVSDIIPSDNCEIINSPKFVRKDKNRYEFEIELKRTNTTKDLLTGVTNHSARVSIIVTKGNLNLKTEYTSTETKKYCTKVVERLNAVFLESRSIETEAKGVLFSDFISNEQRIDYLLGFEKIDYSKTFLNGDIQHIKIKPDPRIPGLPEDIEAMKEKVSNLGINGGNLSDLSYVKLATYKESILLEKVKIKFDFIFQDVKGVCIADIGFPSTLNSRNPDYSTVLQTSIELPKNSKNKSIKNRTRTINALSRKLDEIAMSKYAALEKREKVEA